MKYFIVALLMTVFVGIACAQDNYIRCKHTSTGAVQVFKGMSCPFDWYPV
jgi:hypothetical protein